MGGVGALAIGFDPYFGSNIEVNTCLPPVATLWWNQVHPSLASTVSSLGPFSECPDQYTTATTSAYDDINTLLACCPS